MRYVIAAAVVCIAATSQSFAFDRTFDEFRAAKLERTRQWQAELAAREFEMARATNAWLPPRGVGPRSGSLAPGRPTFVSVPLVIDPPAVPAFYSWSLADRRSYYLRPYAREYAAFEFAQPRVGVGFSSATSAEAVGQRIGAEVGLAIDGRNGAAIGAQAGRVVASELERR